MTRPAASDRAGRPAFGGAVLAGGSSRRMGRDKALVELGGRPLVSRIAGALVDAGADPVRVVGGDATAIGRLGLEVVADRWPGEGPLGGVVTALADIEPVGDGIVVVLTCDLAAIGPAEIIGLVDALVAEPGADIAAPEWKGQPQLLTAAWRQRSAAALRSSFDAGERSVRRAVAGLGLSVVPVLGLDPDHLGDLDTPDDLRAARDAISG